MRARATKTRVVQKETSMTTTKDLARKKTPMEHSALQPEMTPMPAPTATEDMPPSEDVAPAPPPDLPTTAVPDGHSSAHAADAALPVATVAAVPVPTVPLPAATISVAAAVTSPSTMRQPTGLRMRMKVWTDPKTQRRYLMPIAFLSDPKYGVFTAYAMTEEDEDLRTVKLTILEWNALPFFYFNEDGPAPRTVTKRL